MEPLVEGRSLVFPVDSNLLSVDPNQRTLRLWIIYPSQVVPLDQRPTYDETIRRWVYCFTPPLCTFPGRYALSLDGGPECHVAWSITGVRGKLEEQGGWLKDVEGEAGEVPTASRV
jgi:hypothetical protein